MTSVCPSVRAHLFGDDARHHVARAAGGERHDHGHGAGGVVLRVRRQGAREQSDGEDATGSRNNRFLLRFVPAGAGQELRSIFEDLRHLDPASSRAEECRRAPPRAKGRVFAADFGLAVAAYRRGELLELLDERVVLRRTAPASAWSRRA